MQQCLAPDWDLLKLEETNVTDFMDFQIKAKRFNRTQYTIDGYVNLKLDVRNKDFFVSIN